MTCVSSVIFVDARFFSIVLLMNINNVIDIDNFINKIIDNIDSKQQVWPPVFSHFNSNDQ